MFKPWQSLHQRSKPYLVVRRQRSAAQLHDFQIIILFDENKATIRKSFTAFKTTGGWIVPKKWNNIQKDMTQDVYQQQQNGISPITGVQGRMMMNKDDTLTRWRQYFRDLLNQTGTRSCLTNWLQGLLLSIREEEKVSQDLKNGNIIIIF